MRMVLSARPVLAGTGRVLGLLPMPADPAIG
jgi:hypothetical protein